MSNAKFMDVSDADYHLDFARVSASMAKVANGSLSEYFSIYVERSKPAKKSTKAMDTGSIAHDVLLARKEFDDFVAVYPSQCLKVNGAINPTKARDWEETQEQLGIEYFQKEDAAERTKATIAAVKDSEVWQWINSENTLAEKAISWTDDEHELERRCKPDFIIVGKDVIFPFDIKVTEFWTPRLFRKQMRTICWWLQAPFYMDGIREKFPDHDVKPFRWVAVNPEPPHQIAVYRLKQVSVDESAGRCDDLLKRLSEAYRTGNWLDECQLIENEIELTKWDFE